MTEREQIALEVKNAWRDYPFKAYVTAELAVDLIVKFILENHDGSHPNL